MLLIIVNSLTKIFLLLDLMIEAAMFHHVGALAQLSNSCGLGFV